MVIGTAQVKVDGIWKSCELHDKRPPKVDPFVRGSYPTPFARPLKYPTYTEMGTNFHIQMENAQKMARRMYEEAVKQFGEENVF